MERMPSIMSLNASGILNDNISNEEKHSPEKDLRESSNVLPGRNSSDSFSQKVCHLNFLLNIFIEKYVYSPKD